MEMNTVNMKRIRINSLEVKSSENYGKSSVKFFLSATGRKITFSALMLMCIGSFSFGQQTQNYLPKYSNSNGTTNNSVIYQDPSYNDIGIKTNAPQTDLHVHNNTTTICSDIIIGNGNLMRSDTLAGESLFGEELLDSTSTSVRSGYVCSRSGIQLTNVFSGAGYSDGLLIETTNESASIKLQETGSLSLSTTNSQIMYFNGTDVNIGRTNFKLLNNGYLGLNVKVNSDGIPSCRLDVCASTENIIARFSKYSSSSTNLEIRNISNAAQIINNKNGCGLSFNTINSSGVENVNQLFLNGNGGVCIGTTITAYNGNNFKLAVKGYIGAEKVILQSISSWPDYVYQPNYKKRSIKELADYVKIFKHLPGMPSATEIEKRGLDLGEVSRITVEKVEENTLYIIELEEHIDELENQVKTQQVQIDAQDKKIEKLERLLSEFMSEGKKNKNRK